MDEILEALNQLEPMVIPAVELYRNRETHPPTPEQLLQATNFMEGLAGKCESLADQVKKLTAVALTDSEKVWEFPL